MVRGGKKNLFQHVDDPVEMELSSKAESFKQF